MILAALPSGLRAANVEWPREITLPKASIVIYQPQPETFEGNHLTARSAVSVTMKDNPEPVYGAAWYDATVATDRDARTVEVEEVKVTKVKFPDATPEQEQKFMEVVGKEMTGWKLKGSLDRLLTTLQLAKQQEQISGKLSTTPPKILYTDLPAVLVSIDGEPILKAAEGSAIQQVINTPFQIFLDPASKIYYLKGSPEWYSATDLKGAWQVVSQVPEAVARLAAPSEFGGVEEKLASAPKIIVATEPTELIVSDGKPQWEAIAGTDLSYLKNSESVVFRQTPANNYYVLFSGRWFTAKPPAAPAAASAPAGGGLWGVLKAAAGPQAPSAPPPELGAVRTLEGPWTYVSGDQLPEGFRKLPADFPKQGVLASIPGTEEAEEAVMDAQIPQTAVIDKRKAKFDPTYDGAPKFENVSGTSMQYAVNTPNQILKDGDKYYAVDQGVWYVADKPEGPYRVADERPQDVDQIPPDNPDYNTKYVYVYDHDDDSVTAGYTAGYLGAFILGTTLGAAMTWGTGYYYRPWYGGYYYPRPWTYGYHSYYNPYTGGWAFRGPNGGAWYRPSGSWGGWNGNGYWGPGGYRNIETGDININNVNFDRNKIDRDNARNNLYDRNQNLARNMDKDQLRQREQNRLNKLGEQGPLAGRDSSKPIADRPNNIFADKDGNVFQRDKDGQWKERQGNDWKDVEAPQGVKDKVADRDSGNLADKRDAIKDRQGPGGLADKRDSMKDRPQAGDMADQRDALKDRQGGQKLASREPQRATKAAERPAPSQRNTNFDRSNMDRQNFARDRGNQRADNYQRYQASRASYGGGGSFQGGGGGGGGRRGGGGGGRRR
ncbi:MAG: hypothetical protein U1F66_08630 [bacterium]